MKTPVLESLFNKVAGSKACNFVKKRLQRRCFPVKFLKFLRTSFFSEHLRWLLRLDPGLPTLLLWNNISTHTIINQVFNQGIFFLLYSISTKTRITNRRSREQKMIKGTKIIHFWKLKDIRDHGIIFQLNCSPQNQKNWYISCRFRK